MRESSLRDFAMGLLHAALVLRGLSPIVRQAAELSRLIAICLFWRVVRDFRLADQAWDPARELEARDAQNDSTSAAPS